MGSVSGSTKVPAPAPRILDPVGIEGRTLYSETRASSPAAELVERLTADVVLQHVVGRRVLDLGHGAPRVTQWVQARASALTVVDAIDLGHGSEVALALPDQSFDVVYSLRTLPHLGHDDASSAQAATSTLREIARLLRPGGTALVQIDNPRSLWGLYHGIRNPMTVAHRGALVIDSDRGLTRFDTLTRFRQFVPETLSLSTVHGLRVFLTAPHLLAIPIVGWLLQRLEWFARDRSLLRGFGAHLLVVLRRPERSLQP
jgi:SAM-dependent methyltransferase